MEATKQILVVEGGDIACGEWIFFQDSMTNENQKVSLDGLISCAVSSNVGANVTTGLSHAAKGLIGGVLLGPVGLAFGLPKGNDLKIFGSMITCRFSDGKSFTAKCTQLTASMFTQLAELNRHKTELLSQKINFENEISKNTQDDTVECPRCAETIKKKAIVCRFCGHNMT